MDHDHDALGSLQGNDEPEVGHGPAVRRQLRPTAADGSGTIVPAQSLASGSSITVYAITRDASNNFVANVAANAWSLPTKTGGVVNGDLVPSGDSKSATFTGHVTGTATIRATSGALATTDSGLTTVTAGTADAAQSTLTPNSASITANGTSTQVLTVTAKDANGNNLTTGGATVTITRSSGTGTISAVTDNHNGTYTATVTAPTATGSGVFTATLNSSPVMSGTGSQTQATVTYVVGVKVPSAVPTISQWGIIVMAIVFAGLMVWVVRRRVKMA